MSVPGALQRELEVARDAALAAGEVIARHAEGNRESWEKAEDNPVTKADLEANGAILEILGAGFPDDAILLDGTKEFIARIPEFAVSVALAVRGEPVVGVVYQPLDRECFWAARGSGGHRNGERLRVSSARALEQCVLLSSRTEMSRGQVDPYKEWFQEVRPVGSVALKLAWIAAGRGDLWISAAPKNEWDVCAGDLLVREAGGVFLTLEEGPRRYNQADTLLRPLMAAGPPHLVQLLRDQI
jgi:myo-inositol-1(or 4)-monophosphatase